MPNPKWCIALLSVCLLGCGLFKGKDSSSKIEKMELDGVQNVYRLSPRILTGGKPEGETGFSELQKLGVKTIVSVEDTPPDEETAKRYGLTYVHVPMTYEGISSEQRETILSAAGATSEPVYLHCNSGRNRGATAAGICLIGIEGKSNEEAIDWMTMRGVKEEYQGLYEDVRDFKPGSRE